MSLGNILLTGGAGYIGSHCVIALQDYAKRIVVIDNLSTGFKTALSPSVIFYQEDILNSGRLNEIIEKEKIDACIHLAACTVISESISNPLKYYQNNTMGTYNLLQACIAQGVRHFIYSSTAAVYGLPQQAHIDENHPILAQNPYGESKAMAERMIQDVGRSSPLQYIIFRYFNVAGADPNGQIGQCTPNATHLIKTAVQVACHKRDTLPIYGRNHPTPDGTCIRDFIHVSDLAAAHVAGLKYLQAGGQNQILNCGYGRGHSVQEIINTVQNFSDHKLSIIDMPPRAGDLAEVVANVAKIKRTLHWKPQFDDIKLIVSSALAWEKKISF